MLGPGLASRSKRRALTCPGAQLPVSHERSRVHGAIRWKGPALRHDRALLIDEVDVFFGSDFYGNVWEAVLQIEGPEVESLARPGFGSWGGL